MILRGNNIYSKKLENYVYIFHNISRKEGTNKTNHNQKESTHQGNVYEKEEIGVYRTNVIKYIRFRKRHT